ncbi:hypothetical protein M9H77_01541 [Catharanthus roseus]|uniref:Uncharacterized protein n=1 Tax=Catharanthus roseus TaxID=4058 RepID=A0ACC0C5V8_CATRO|nr:hypothetical protein M9H77_01541 [Catharanthus roseus]
MFRENLNRVSNNVVKEKVDEEPFKVREVGSFFNNIDDLFDSYLMYAKSRIFSVAKKSSSKGNSGSFRKYQTIACNRGIKCLARLSAILRDNSMWEMSKFMLAHRMIHSNVKRKLEANDMAGIRPSKSPKKVILVRKKEMHMRHTRIFFEEGYPRMSMEFEKYKELEKIFNEIVDLALSSEARILKFKQLLESNKTEVLNCNGGAGIVVNQSTKSERSVVLNPNVAVSKGQLRSNCLKATNESSRRNRRCVDNSGRHASNAQVHLKMVQDLKTAKQMYQQQFKEKRKFTIGSDSLVR